MLYRSTQVAISHSIAIRAANAKSLYHVMLWVVSGFAAWLTFASADAFSAQCATRVTAPPNAHTLTVDTATYFGLSVDDAIYAAEFSPDCTLLVGGRVTAGVNGAFTDVTSVGNPLSSIVNGTTGSVARLSTDGTTLIARSTFGTQVNDLAVSQTTGDVAVASDIALAVVASDLVTVRWSVTGGANRVAMTADGRVAALFGKTLRVYGGNGTLLFQNAFGDSFVGDVAIDAASAQVFVTGFAQRDGSSCSQLQVAWIRAYDMSGAATWANYDWARGVADAHGDCADTRGRLVTMGEDGKLYFAGTSAGGNAIFRWQPRNLATEAYNVKPGDDKYVDPYQTRSNHITYLARFDPATGNHEAGFFLLTRLTNNDGNTIEPRAIAADSEGRIYAGGFAASQLLNRPSVIINGTTLAAYAGEDAWLFVTSLDYVSRETWLAFNNGGKATIRAIAVSRGAVALGASVSLAPLFVSANALQQTPPAAPNPIPNLLPPRAGYLATFAMPAPAVPARCMFDVDADGDINAAVDALVLIRYLQGVTGNALVAKTGIATTGTNAARTRATLARSTFALDIDGNGAVEPATDGLLLTRALLGFKGAALTSGALGAPPLSGMWRNTPALVESYLATQCVQ
jgi:Dockerin type I domain